MEADVGNDAPAQIESKQYMASAKYYGVHRQRIPSLVNEYLAIKKSFTNAAGLNATFQLEIRSNNDTSSELLRYEPTFTPAMVLGAGAGTLGNVAYGMYDEFRIRAVRVSLQSNSYHLQNSRHVEKYIWYIPNHWEFDSESATELTTYLQLRQMKNAGEHIVDFGHSPDHGLSLACVPQIQMSNADETYGTIYQDIPMPWLPCNDLNKFRNLRMPMIIFRKPLIANSTDDQLICAYDVMFTAVMEFRNVDINKL